MFEEYIAETWICPHCGEVNKVRVEEVRKSIYERSPEFGEDTTLFELLRFEGEKLKVICYESGFCGFECYK